MREVKVRRSDLLEKIKANREKHIADYKEAVAGYKQAALAAIDDGVAKLRKQVDELDQDEVMALTPVYFELAVPQSHAKDYDQVIAMLEMSVDEQLTIRSDEFAMYVMDDWQWKAAFERTKLSYSGNVGAVKRQR